MAHAAHTAAILALHSSTTCNKALRVRAQVSGDPRRPDDIVRYKRPAKKGDEPGDLMLVLVMILAGVGLMFKVS